MKKLSAAALVFSLLASPAWAQSMANMPGVNSGAQASKTGKGVGTIVAIDRKAAKVTIKHGPIAAVGWPAMTMAFKTNPATLLDRIHAGQTIAFGVRTGGADAEVVSAQPH